MDVSGLVCVVTGGASGIGLATVRQLATRGAIPIVLSINELECGELEAEGKRSGWDIEIAVGDVGDEGAWARVGEIVERRGRVDVLVNNAGYGIQGDVLDTDPQAWDALMRTNVTGVYLGSRAMLPWMIQAKTGSIVNVASVAGQIGMPRRAAYCASKAAIVGLTRAMAVDHARQGVRVNARTSTRSRPTCPIQLPTAPTWPNASS
jgi:meso-butanediol dehydrogenase/(S,S)-butanediol dehydrogenase/diacetyl reductase